jgi:predicted nucleic acid-binding protein
MVAGGSAWSHLRPTHFSGLRLLAVPQSMLLDRMWQLRGTVTAYDAAYVVAAELMACPLVTGDGRLAKASGVRCEIRLLALS